MSILKYKDPKTGEFKRINPYKADLSFVGKDGIVVNKDPNSEEVEISGSGCVQKTNTSFVLYGTTTGGAPLNRSFADNPTVNAIAQYSNTGILRTNSPIKDNDCTNKKYVADNYVEKVKFTNLEQALYGYILDTTKEAYADLDSAVLKDSVAVGDNVYPIADKTRALVTRIEGKTTKMVQLFDKSVIPATKTVNGITYTNNNDGSVTINGTATNESFIVIVTRDKITDGHKILHGSEQNTSDYGVAWGTNLPSTKFNTLTINNNYTVIVKSGVTVDNVKIYPNLFDLTAMNREDITTVEQFKAEFPDLYPYENGNIYPAKISGVKFTGKNLLKLELSSTNKSNANIEGDVLKITPTTQNAEDIVFAEVKTHLKAGEYVFSSIDKNTNTTGTQFIIAKGTYGKDNITSIFSKGTKFTLDSEHDIYILIYPCLHAELPFKAMSVQMQIQAGSQATAYKPYIEPVSVTLTETYDLHGIGDFKDYLEITKNENNELYTLKKIQAIDKHVFDGTEAWTVSGRVLTICQAFYTTVVSCLFVDNGKGGLSNNLPLGVWDSDTEHIQFGQANNVIYVFLNKEKFTTDSAVQEYLAAQYASGNPLIAYYILPTPVETVIATNLTYEQVTAIRHNGGLIEVVGNTNKAYAKPTIKNTVVYRLTATNKAEV